MIGEIVKNSLSFVTNTVSSVFGYFNKKRELELKEKALEYQHTENMTGADNDSNILIYGQYKAQATAIKNGVLGLVGIGAGAVLLYKVIKNG